jgi:hypothetical protein
MLFVIDGKDFQVSSFVIALLFMFPFLYVLTFKLFVVVFCFACSILCFCISFSLQGHEQVQVGLRSAFGAQHYWKDVCGEGKQPAMGRTVLDRI